MGARFILQPLLPLGKKAKAGGLSFWLRKADHEEEGTAGVAIPWWE